MKKRRPSHAQPQAERLAELPVWQSQATPEEQEENRAWARQQHSLIAEQAMDEVPIVHIKIRCDCGALVNWMLMHKCLYCSIWFCRQCAQEHFGYRLPG